MSEEMYNAIFIGVNVATALGNAFFIQCFKEDTLVKTEDGDKPIQDIKVGDKVLAFDEKTGQTEYKTVKQLFRNETNEWIHIEVNGEDISCTAEHPYFVQNRGWVAAKDLKADDVLLLANGTVAAISAVCVEHLDEPQATYNFEVEGFHTYFVSSNGVLVHNACLTNRQMNNYKKEIMSGNDVTLPTKENSLHLIKAKFSSFPQELAQARGPQGWHFDLHPIAGMGTNAIEHINIYSKAMNFRVHITWLS
jgi:hypothetical protein